MFQPEIGNECAGEKLHVSLMHKWKMKEWKSAGKSIEIRLRMCGPPLWHRFSLLRAGRQQHHCLPTSTQMPRLSQHKHPVAASLIPLVWSRLIGPRIRSSLMDIPL